MPAAKQDDEKQPGFRVSDRRSFTDSAETRAEEARSVATEADAVAPAAPNAEPPTQPPAAAAQSAEGEPDEQDSGPLPPVDFHTFILSLGSSALLHLGELDAPDGRASRPNLRMAKHTIDIIGMLQGKTRGNLSSPEERLLESLLYDLRLRYVECGKK
jgi:hypothetical protein